jgi:hypothetical protein
MKLGAGDRARFGFLLVVTFALVDWQRFYRAWVEAIHPPPESLAHWREAMYWGVFDEQGRLLRPDGHKPECAASYLAASTDDLALVMEFLDQRVEWFRDRFRDPAWSTPEPLDLGQAWIHGRTIASSGES